MSCELRVKKLTCVKTTRKTSVGHDDKCYLDRPERCDAGARTWGRSDLRSLLSFFALRRISIFSSLSLSLSHLDISLSLVWERGGGVLLRGIASRK
jgi:hypothetical protein